MKAIPAADWKRLGKIGDDIEKLKAQFEEAWQSTMVPILEAMDEKREEARVVLDDFVSAAEDWRSERSEKWQESDAASEHESWLNDVSEVRDTLENEQEAEAPELETVEEWLTGLRENLKQRVDD